MKYQSFFKSMHAALIPAVLAGIIAGACAGGIVAGILFTRLSAAAPAAESGARTLAETVFTEEEAVIQAVEDVTPAVVSIIVTKDLPVYEQYYINPFDGFFPFDFQVPKYREKGTEQQRIGGGSGFIVSSDGLIVTNKHVVSLDDVDYTVIMNDGKTYNARVLGRDPIQDLALLKIDAKNLNAVRLGDSSSLKIGQKVIAIGYALGEFPNTVSLGIISGLSRSIIAGGGLGQSSEEYEGLIQTDAAINQGNSGGPLLNLSGEVIGVNTAMAANAENIGFAIPINSVKKDIDEVKETGKITYPFLGVRYVAVTPDIQQEKNLSVDYGALIVSGQEGEEPAVVPGSPAEAAGIREGDIILEVSGQRIDTEHTLAQLLGEHRAGESVTLLIFRDGEKLTLKAKLSERNA